ncbi:MAG: LuxR C-terminal-related transcriptional regulator [Treponema sp.]|nr:LuxR C-terminal-related transcriptional regulator [Treponema sp.]
MDTSYQKDRNNRTSLFFERPRLNSLFMEAVNYPLVFVCAGAGYGKTSAVHDFLEAYQTDTYWLQISELDNAGTRFWEHHVHAMAQINKPLAKIIDKFGFPDTTEKLSHYMAMLHNQVGGKRLVLVMDDTHLLLDSSILRFAEYVVHNIPPEHTIIVISRSSPRINIASLVSKNQVFTISEDDLRFTENECAQYFHQLDIPIQPESLRSIMQDTNGWAFAINLIARSYTKAPGYDGYLRSAMKSNIFEVMETEIWGGISGNLQQFLIRLSLIGHLSLDLIILLAKGDGELIAELGRQNAYIRRDSYINAYLIHPLFLEFLAAKQELLSEEQKRETYTIAGDWCGKNGFKIDALSYHEKTGDYEKIVSIIAELPYQIPYDIAKFTEAVLDRAPAQAFNEVEDLAIIHLRVCMCQGLWQKSIDLAEQYEKKFLKIPGNSAFKKHTLGGIYYSWAIVRTALCITDDSYDFDNYFKKFVDSVSGLDYPDKIPLPANSQIGPWIIFTGSSRKGAPEACIAVLANTVKLISGHFNGRMAGEDVLALGELQFYRGDLHNAELSVRCALDRAREHKQFEIIHRSLFYLLRIAIVQGNYAKAEQALKDMKAYQDENEYANRFTNYDISQCWYYCALGLSEKVPDWLKGNFSPYAYTTLIENYANQMKARYCYQTRNYPPLLSYIQEMRRRESYLFGRVEMLAIEACVHYKTDDKKKACTVLREAYETASPNNVLMPFIELGRDMRTLTAGMIKRSRAGIPLAWLENISRKSASYAKQLAHVVTEYKQTNSIPDNIFISPREREILNDLSHGLTRMEIAASHGLSINTVKMVINNLYDKMGAENLPDVIHIATERKLI